MADIVSSFLRICLAVTLIYHPSTEVTDMCPKSNLWNILLLFVLGIRGSDTLLLPYSYDSVTDPCAVANLSQTISYKLLRLEVIIHFIVIAIHAFGLFLWLSMQLYRCISRRHYTPLNYVPINV
jgi:hypothetical protein